eukprot:485650-Amphidinium_carterae.2
MNSYSSYTFRRSDVPGELAAIARSYGQRADVYQQMLDNLGACPPEPPMTAEDVLWWKRVTDIAH